MQKHFSSSCNSRAAKGIVDQCPPFKKPYNHLIGTDMWTNCSLYLQHATSQGLYDRMRFATWGTYQGSTWPFGFTSQSQSCGFKNSSKTVLKDLKDKRNESCKLKLLSSLFKKLNVPSFVPFSFIFCLFNESKFYKTK